MLWSVGAGKTWLMDAAESSLQARNFGLNQVWILKVGSKSRFYPFRSILWGQNPFPIHFMGSKSIFFDLRCPVLIRKIDLLSRLWVKSWRIVSIYFRFLKIVCIWCILWLYETKWLPKGCRKVTERLLKGCCFGCKFLNYWKLYEVKKNVCWGNYYRL